VNAKLGISGTTISRGKKVSLANARTGTVTLRFSIRSSPCADRMIVVDRSSMRKDNHGYEIQDGAWLFLLAVISASSTRMRKCLDFSYVESHQDTRMHHEAWTIRYNVTDCELRSVPTLPARASVVLWKRRQRTQRRNDQQRNHQPNQTGDQLQPGRSRLRAQGGALSGRQQRRSVR